MIVGIDFDGTVCTHDYPYVGKNIGAVGFLKALVANGHKLVLCTMRSHPKAINKADLKKTGSSILGTYGDMPESDPLKDALDWFEKNGIELYGVNECPGQRGWTGSPKPYAQLYIDDAALGCPLKKVPGHPRPFVDWRRVGHLLIDYGLITVKQYQEAVDSDWFDWID